MTDWTCFAYYSSNNTFCSTPTLSTSLFVNVFFLFAGNARLHEKQRLFSFFFSLFVMPWISRTTLWTTGKFHLVLFAIHLLGPLHNTFQVTSASNANQTNPFHMFSICNKFCSAGCGDTAFFFSFNFFNNWNALVPVYLEI